MKASTLKMAVVLMLIVSLFVTPITEAKAKPLATLPPGIEVVLSNYSQYLDTGATARRTEFSLQMTDLVSERQEYYREFFAKGLHANLTVVDTQFITDQEITVTKRGNVYFVDLYEKVTMSGEPITTSPEDYPLIQAAKWALTETDNENIKAELNQYIESMTIGVNESVQEGIEIVFWNKHSIEVKEEKGQFQIIKDTFTDKAADNGKGFDNVAWANGRFVRGESVWASMIDYKIYHTPIEVLGQSLLNDFQPSANRAEFSISSVSYNRTTAKNYVNTYSSNTTLKPAECGGSILRDTSYWNPNYSYLWNADATIRCNDCTDFVSQALYAGGIPQDSVWYANRYNTPWINVNALRDYLINTYDGIYLVSASYLQIGELVIIPNSHIAMTTNINPHRVSGHTNDRKNYPMSGSYTQFLHISNNP